MGRERKKINLLFYVGALITLMLIMMVLFSSFRTNAADSITVVEINYENSTITLQANAGDKAIYFSDVNERSWLSIPGKLSSDKKITMDISWISTTSNYILTFKGDVSKTVISVTIPKKVTNFKAAFNSVKGTVTFSNTSNRTIQWRKQGSSIWTDVPYKDGTVDATKLAENLSYLYTKGATIYFRLSPQNGTLSEEGARASSEVSITIPKKIAAPTVSVDGSKMIVAVKSGMAYRLVDKDGNVLGNGTWKSITAAMNLKLSDIATKALYNKNITSTENAANQEKVYLQFRTNATSTSQVSLIKTLIVPIQEGVPSEADNGIVFEYTSSSTLSLTVKAASATKPFEYTIIEKDDKLDLVQAAWTPITSNTAISLNKTSVKEGSHIYLRKKSIVQTSTVDFSLASVEIDVTGESGVKYPEAVTANKLNTFITTAGVCNTSNTGTNFVFTLYSPSKATVSAINFKDIYGKLVGTVTSKSTVTKNMSPTQTNGSDAYIITTKITSTEGIDKTTLEKLYADIVLTSGETITSTTTSGVMMYIYPNSKVNNPEDVIKDNEGNMYLKSFERVYQSHENDDAKGFTFVIDFGEGYLFDENQVDTFTTVKTAIESIVYNDYTLLYGTDYVITTGFYIDDSSDKKVYTAKVTVFADKFETNAKITVRDTIVPFMIKLNNGEILDKEVSMKLVRTATIDQAPIAWSLIEDSLKETTTTTTYDSKGFATTTTAELVTYTINLTLFNKNYGVSISDVTWGGVSVLHSADTSGGITTIKLSNAKINSLQTNTTTTNNLIITLSNGYTITSGCKLTILDSGN